MKPKMIWANLAVSDLERTTGFYTGLGFKANGKPNNDLTSFRFGDDGFVVHFFEQHSTIADYLPVGAQKGNEIIFTLSAETEQEVNDMADKVRAEGGTILREAERDEAGYYNCAFTDPDGHKFNILLMDNM